MVDPEVSPEQTCMLGRISDVLGEVRLSLKTYKNSGEAPCPHPLTQAVKRVRQNLGLPCNLA